MISFENTEIAFRNKSNKDLNRAYWLFKIIGNRSFVKFGKWLTNVALDLKIPIKWLVKKTIFKQFCGGESIEECYPTIENLGNFGIGTILDYSIEGKTTHEEFDHAVNEIISTINHGKLNTNIPFAVFKISGISVFSILEKANENISNLSESEYLEYEKMENCVTRICQAAFDSNVPVFIDAEESWIQNTIDRVALKMMQKYNTKRAIVYNTLQMYRHDRLLFLEDAIRLAKEHSFIYGVKLVRGAYMEKERKRAIEKGYPSPIQCTKEATDKDFNAALNLLIQSIDFTAFCAGTHNEESSLLLIKMMEKNKLVKNDHRIYFAQLLGMSDHISYNLSNETYNVAKYVPYGPIKEVIPYLLRRADENTSVAGQTGRELSLLTKEKKRRKEEYSLTHP